MEQKEILNTVRHVPIAKGCPDETVLVFLHVMLCRTTSAGIDNGFKLAHQWR